MLTRNNPLVPVLHQPAPVFIKLVSLLLKNMQKKTAAKQGVANHYNNKDCYKDIKKKCVPVIHAGNIDLELTNEYWSLK